MDQPPHRGSCRRRGHWFAVRAIAPGRGPPRPPKTADPRLSGALAAIQLGRAAGDVPWIHPVPPPSPTASDSDIRPRKAIHEGGGQQPLRLSGRSLGKDGAAGSGQGAELCLQRVDGQPRQSPPPWPARRRRLQSRKPRGETGVPRRGCITHGPPRPIPHRPRGFRLSRAAP